MHLFSGSSFVFENASELGGGGVRIDEFTLSYVNELVCKKKETKKRKRKYKHSIMRQIHYLVGGNLVMALTLYIND